MTANATQRANSAATTGRFDKQATDYSRYAAIQRDMAAWLAQWLPTQNQIPQDQVPQTDILQAQDRKLTRSPLCAPLAADATQTTAAAQKNTELQVLDLGAGDGAFTRYLAKCFVNITALDSATQMLCQGRSKLPDARWLRGDAWTLQPLGNAELANTGLITSASLLQWCRTPQATLRHWAGCCRPGTRMLHGLYAEPTLREWRTVFGNAGQLGWLQADQWRTAFAQAGWRIVRSEHEVRHYRFASALQLARSLHGTGAIANAGQLGAGRFRSLLRAYDTAFVIDKLPPTQPLFNFFESRIQTDNCDTRETEAIDQCITGSRAGRAANSGTAGNDTADTGVFASWAFFRIEAERI